MAGGGGAGRLKMAVALQLLALALALSGEFVGAQVHHVVGGDRGWDASTDVAAWSSGRTFRVGDKIWFSYSAAQESIAELRSKEQYESCDVSNPIRMYRDGIESITLEEEGTRYFASLRPEKCKNGLKLNVQVEPQQMEPDPDRTPTISTSEVAAIVMAATAPASPSECARTATSSLLLLLVGLLFCSFMVSL